MTEVKICDLKTTIKTSDADGKQLYAMSRLNPLRWVFMKRLKLLIDFFEGYPRFDTLMEVGFGCGILVPELSSHCENYVGIDIHENVEKISNMLKEQYPRATFHKTSVINTEFADNSFDAIFAMSVLEHIAEIDLAIKEVQRILKPGGKFFVGFPIENIASNAFLDIVKLAIGFDRKIHHPVNHSQILEALKRRMKLEKERAYPFSNSIKASLFYTGVWTKE